MASSCGKSTVKRNLNDSFNNKTSLSTLNYSIDTSDDDNPLVIKLTKSTRFRTQSLQKRLEEEVINNIYREYGDDESNCSAESLNEHGTDSSNVITPPLKQRISNTQNMGNIPFVILKPLNIQEILTKENGINAKNNFGNRTCTPKKNGATANTSNNILSSHTLPVLETQNRSSPSIQYTKECKIDSRNGLNKNIATSTPNKIVADTADLLKETLKISDMSPHVCIERLEVRKSNRIRKKVSNKEYDYFNKTPSKRNRKLSTDSNSSAVIDPPKKICSPRKYKQELYSNTSSGFSPRKIQTRNSVKKYNGTPGKNVKPLDNNYSPSKKSSTPLKEMECETPVKDRLRRNVNTPLRFRNSDDETSPKKKTKSERQNRMSSVVVLSSDESMDFEKIRIDLQKTNIRDTNEVRTPTKKYNCISDAQTPRSRMRNTPSAKAKLIRNGTITPSVQMRATPIKNDSTPLNKARTKLHVSYLPKKLVCREKEYDNILNFLQGKLLDGCGGCIYISGVPGTGKTASVTDVIRKLQEKSKSGVLPDFQFVSINGMKLSEPRQSYVEILKQLTGKAAPWEQAQSTLDSRFTKPGKKTTPIILLVDELDILCTKRQDVVYNLLDWPTRASTQLIVITIANTMDLPERLLMGRVTSRLGLTRLTFQAYTHKQLQEIVTLRLMGTKVFNPDAIQLVARKVASVSGDARRALDICRRAAEIAELEGPDTLVSMSHVNKALDAMITQPKVKAIKGCSRLQQLILQSVVAEVGRTGVEETTFSDVYRMFESVAAIDGFQRVSYTVVMAAVSRLGACRLLLTDQKYFDFHQKLILNVSADDVYFALRAD